MKQLQEILLPVLDGIYAQILGILPSLLAATIILLVGWLVARGFSGLVSRLLKKMRFNSMAERAGITGFLRNSDFDREPSWIVGRVIFWLLMLTFILSAANTLQLTMFAATIQKVVSFIPNLIAVIFIVVLGAWFARFAGRITRGTAMESGIGGADLLGKLTTNLILVMVAVIAINQLEIQSSILEIAFAAVLSAVGLAIALTLGIGTKSIAQNIISGVYARKSFHPGQKITVGETKGKILQIGTVNTTIGRDEKVVSIPNRMLVEEIAVSEEP
jgi:hypothetical protein